MKLPQTISASWIAVVGILTAVSSFWVIVFVVAICGHGTALVTPENEGGASFVRWGELFSALAGAGGGAYAAYHLQTKAEKRKERELQYQAILRAQLRLVAQRNTLKNIYHQHLKTHAADFQNRHLTLTFSHARANDPLVEADSLWFLLTQSHPDLLLHLHLSQRLYAQADDHLVAQERVHAEFFDAIPSASFDATTKQLSIPLTSETSIRLQELKNRTDRLYDTFEQAITKAEEIFPLLRKAAREQFPPPVMLPNISGELYPCPTLFPHDPSKKRGQKGTCLDS